MRQHIFLVVVREALKGEACMSLGQPSAPEEEEEDCYQSLSPQTIAKYRS
jgi:hypothetical protein